MWISKKEYEKINSRLEILEMSAESARAQLYKLRPLLKFQEEAQSERSIKDLVIGRDSTILDALMELADYIGVEFKKMPATKEKVALVKKSKSTGRK